MRGDSADIRIFDTEAEAEASMRLGTRRLLLIAVPSGARSIAGRLPMTAKMAMSRHPYASAAALLDDCAAAAADQVIADAGGPAWDADGFAQLVEAARNELAPVTARVLDSVAQILAEAHEVEIRLASAGGGRYRRWPGPWTTYAPSSPASSTPDSSLKPGRPGCATWSGICAPSYGGWTSSQGSRPETQSGWPSCTG